MEAPWSALVGTPLWEEEDGGGRSQVAAARSTLPLHQQEVVDVEGRRRFHGAFTGGFSAGYYNTVGSAEGWTPATFRSSRGERAERGVATAAEDFMDEEDLRSFGGKQLEANSDFDALGSTAADVRRQAESLSASSRGVIPGAAPDELVAPSCEPVGKRLLKLMGWRDGQGIGPRTKGQRRKRRAPGGARDAGGSAGKTNTKVYGCALPQQLRAGLAGEEANGTNGSHDDKGEGGDGIPAKYGLCDTLFAPRNTAVFDSGSGKDNFFGLGFDPHSDAPEFRATAAAAAAAAAGGRHMGLAAEAWGVGALEEEDDPAVYSRSTDRSEYVPRMCQNLGEGGGGGQVGCPRLTGTCPCRYDFQLGGDDPDSPHHVRSGGTGGEYGGRTQKGRSASHHFTTAGYPGTSDRVSSDGARALGQFVIATHGALEDTWSVRPRVRIARRRSPVSLRFVSCKCMRAVNVFRFPAPALPRAFVPMHKFGEDAVSETTKANWTLKEDGTWQSQPTSAEAPAAPGRRAQLSASDRGQALGEVRALCAFFFFFFFLVQAGYVLAFAVTLHRWQARRPPARAVPHHAAARRSEQLPMAAQAGMSDAERQRLTSMLAAGDRFVKASDSKASGCAQSTLSLVCAHLELLACCGVLCSGRLSVWLLLLDISSE
jgi:hypothetical protein